MRNHIALLAATSMLLAGCSTRPREFRPKAATPVAVSPSADETEAASPPDVFDQTLIQCQVMVRKGVKGNFANTMAQGAVGAGAGIAAGAAASSIAIASASSSSSLAVFPGLAAGTAALVVVTPLSIFGTSRLIRSGREKKYKRSLGNCLSEFGYTVTDWEKQKKLSKAEVKAVTAKLQTAPPSPPPSPPQR